MRFAGGTVRRFQRLRVAARDAGAGAVGFGFDALVGDAGIARLAAAGAAFGGAFARTALAETAERAGAGGVDFILRQRRVVAAPQDAVEAVGQTVADLPGKNAQAARFDIGAMGAGERFVLAGTTARTGAGSVAAFLFGGDGAFAQIAHPDGGGFQIGKRDVGGKEDQEKGDGRRQQSGQRIGDAVDGEGREERKAERGQPVAEQAAETERQRPEGKARQRAQGGRGEKRRGEPGGDTEDDQVDAAMREGARAPDEKGQQQQDAGETERLKHYVGDIGAGQAHPVAGGAGRRVVEARIVNRPAHHREQRETTERDQRDANALEGAARQESTQRRRQKGERVDEPALHALHPPMAP